MSQSSGVIRCLLFCDWLLSLGASRSVRAGACDGVSSFLRRNSAAPRAWTLGLCTIFQWALGVLPPLGYCKRCCCECGCSNVFLGGGFASQWRSVWFPLDRSAGRVSCAPMWVMFAPPPAESSRFPGRTSGALPGRGVHRVHRRLPGDWGEHPASSVSSAAESGHLDARQPARV